KHHPGEARELLQPGARSQGRGAGLFLRLRDSVAVDRKRTMSDTPEPAADVLDQSEVDELLTAHTDAAPPPAVLPSAAQNGRRVERHDFRHPVLLTEAELRRLRLLHDEFVRYLSARL